MQVAIRQNPAHIIFKKIQLIKVRGYVNSIFADFFCSHADSCGDDTTQAVVLLATIVVHPIIAQIV
jgi:ADP-ribosylglycohydrolase